MNHFKLALSLVIFQFSIFGLYANKFNSYSWETISVKGEPIERHEASFVEANGKFYLIGGRKIKPVSIYDPKTQTWSTGTKPPIELHHFQGFSYKGNIYIVCAQTGSYPHEKPLATMFIYRTKTDTWLIGPEIPKNRLRGSAGVSVYKNKIYISGGIIDGHWDGHVKWFDCYNLKTGKWDSLVDIPRFRDHFNSVVCNDKLYLLGGRVTSGSIDKVFELTVGEIDVYDFKTRKWSTLKQSVLTQRAGCTSIAVKNKIILGGGESIKQLDAHSEVEVFDTKLEKWSNLPPLQQGRHGTQFIYYHNCMYIASGCAKRGGFPELKSIEYLKLNK